MLETHRMRFNSAMNHSGQWTPYIIFDRIWRRGRRRLRLRRIAEL